MRLEKGVIQCAIIRLYMTVYYSLSGWTWVRVSVQC